MPTLAVMAFVPEDRGSQTAATPVDSAGWKRRVTSSASDTGSLFSRSRSRPARLLVQAAGPEIARRWCSASVRRRGSSGVDELLPDAVEHGQGRLDASAGVLDRVDRRVAAEVDDPPAARAEREPEGDQAEVVPLARKAGKQCGGTASLAPTARETEQPAAQHARGEVLLRD